MKRDISNTMLAALETENSELKIRNASIIFQKNSLRIDIYSNGTLLNALEKTHSSGNFLASQIKSLVAVDVHVSVSAC